MIDIIERLMICAKFDPDQKEAAELITRLRIENEKILDGMRGTIRERDILSGENYDLRKENEKLEQQVAEFVNKFTEDMFVLRAENEKLQKQSVDSYNAAIDAAALIAKTWGPPNWSWSESSIIIKDTCDEIALAIRGLKKCTRQGESKNV